jgi:hypothetical protein
MIDEYEMECEEAEKELAKQKKNYIKSIFSSTKIKTTPTTYSNSPAQDPLPSSSHQNVSQSTPEPSTTTSTKTEQVFIYSLLGFEVFFLKVKSLFTLLNFPR